jgi:hypothetical protein
MIQSKKKQKQTLKIMRLAFAGTKKVPPRLSKQLLQTLKAAMKVITTLKLKKKKWQNAL